MITVYKTRRHEFKDTAQNHLCKFLLINSMYAEKNVDSVEMK